MLRRTFFVAAAITASLAVPLTAWAQSAIVVGGKAFTEQILLTEMTMQLLEAKGFKVTRKAGMGNAILRAAQENGEVDLYWEYTGTSLVTHNKVSDKLNAADTYRRVKELDAAKNLVWLNVSPLNNTFALAMRKDDAAKRGITSIADLASAVRASGNLTFASNAEFPTRPDGLKPLEESYGFEFGRENVKRMDAGLTYQALRDKQVDVALVYSTDGRIAAFNFIVLKDTKGFFPSYALAPVIRKEALAKNPKVAEPLNALAAKLNDVTMQRLNASVDVEKKTVEEVANAFLKSNGLL
jgi:osmoprotectant transport system substrate-binding protein